MSLKQIGTLGDLMRGVMHAGDSERRNIIDWLRAHEDQHERAIAAGACIRGSTTHGELRDQAAYYMAVAEALEERADWSWRVGLSKDEWLYPPPQSERTGA